MTRKGSLYPPVAEPITINPLGVIFMSFIFALVFFVIGVLTMHYPKIVGAI